MQHRRRTRGAGRPTGFRGALVVLAAALPVVCGGCEGALAGAPRDGWDAFGDAPAGQLGATLVPHEFVGTFVCGVDDAPTVLAESSPSGRLDVHWISPVSTHVCRAEGSFRVLDERVVVRGLPAADCAPEAGDVAPARAIDVIAIRHVDDASLVFGPPGFELTCRRSAALEGVE